MASALHTSRQGIGPCTVCGSVTDTSCHVLCSIQIDAAINQSKEQSSRYRLLVQMTPLLSRIISMIKSLGNSFPASGFVLLALWSISLSLRYRLANSHCERLASVRFVPRLGPIIYADGSHYHTIFSVALASARVCHSRPAHEESRRKCSFGQEQKGRKDDTEQGKQIEVHQHKDSAATRTDWQCALLGTSLSSA